MHKIIFTITCEGETLYDAQKLAMNVSGVLDDYTVVKKGVTIETTVEKDVVKIDIVSVGITDITSSTVWDDGKTPYTLT